MKRSLAFVLAVLMLLGLTGCGGYEGPNPVGTYYNADGMCLQILGDGTWEVEETDIYGTWEYEDGSKIRLCDSQGWEGVYDISNGNIVLMNRGFSSHFHRETISGQSTLNQAIIGTWSVIEEGVSREVYPESDSLTFFNDGTFRSGTTKGYYTLEGDQLMMGSDKWLTDYHYTIMIQDGILSIQYPNYASLRFEQ